MPNELELIPHGKGRKGGARSGAGRKLGTKDRKPRVSHGVAVIPKPVQRLVLKEAAMIYAQEAVDKIVHLMRYAESEAIQAAQASIILDRAFGKAESRDSLDVKVTHTPAWWAERLERLSNDDMTVIEDDENGRTD